MDRRKFCRIAALAVGAIGLGAEASTIGSRHVGSVVGRRCHVRVVRRECYDDLQSLYADDPEAGPCGAFECGMEWTLAAGDGRPEGFCPKAWEAVVSAVGDVSQCPASAVRQGVMMVSCPDGFRPVIFKIELGELAD
ncbi:MAG: TIGR04076 family protein [Muribaculaceae bacterium]|nr:TIGR04076 family protein [Muribaculaceae bacterium]